METDRQTKPDLRANTFARFWSHVRATTNPADCWEWTASNVRGYGHFSVDGKAVIATRWIYAFLFGEVPDGHFVCHHCDNPKCVNPAHLYVGTPRQNTLEMHSKGRWADRRGERHPLARLTEDSVRAIRQQAAMGVAYSQIAEDFGMSTQHIGKIVRKESWNHV